MDGPTLKKYADVSGVIHTDDNMLIEFHAARRTGLGGFVSHLKNFLEVLAPRNTGWTSVYRPARGTDRESLAAAARRIGAALEADKRAHEPEFSIHP